MNERPPLFQGSGRIQRFGWACQSMRQHMSHHMLQNQVIMLLSTGHHDPLQAAPAQPAHHVTHEHHQAGPVPPVGSSVADVSWCKKLPPAPCPPAPRPQIREKQYACTPLQLVPRLMSRRNKNTVCETSSVLVL